jgi:pimeloyl-ACP methyl ester carboxylesterase
MNIEVHPGLIPKDTLFIHGNLASNTWWRPALSVWQNRAQSQPHAPYEGRLIFGEWRGCGKSSAPASAADLNPAVLADDYILALKTLGIKKACLVGHSNGGLIALFALLRAPELFDRVVLLDPVSATGVQFEQPMYDAFTAMSKDRDMCKTVMSATINGTVDPAFLDAVVDDAFGVSKVIWHGVPDAIKTVNIVADLQKIKHPVLIMHGDQDPILPIEGSIAMAAHLGNATFVKLEGRGHSANVENPQLFVEKTHSFLFGH